MVSGGQRTTQPNISAPVRYYFSRAYVGCIRQASYPACATWGRRFSRYSVITVSRLRRQALVARTAQTHKAWVLPPQRLHSTPGHAHWAHTGLRPPAWSTSLAGGCVACGLAPFPLSTRWPLMRGAGVRTWHSTQCRSHSPFPCLSRLVLVVTHPQRLAVSVLPVLSRLASPPSCPSSLHLTHARWLPQIAAVVRALSSLFLFLPQIRLVRFWQALSELAAGRGRPLLCLSHFLPLLFRTLTNPRSVASPGASTIRAAPPSVLFQSTTTNFVYEVQRSHIISYSYRSQSSNRFCIISPPRNARFNDHRPRRRPNP